jgi:mannose-6-phosphate isomerase-like protein (cupin superfamily)
MAGKMDEQQFMQQVIWMGEWTRSPEWAVRSVNSPHSILWLILGGNKQVRIQGMSYRLAPGDLVMISPRTLHSVSASPDTDRPLSIGAWLHFEIRKRRFFHQIQFSPCNLH